MAGARRRTVIVDGPEPVDVKVGHRLRLARYLAGISQIELADRLGLTFQAVQKYEQGENRMSASKLYAAARVVAQPVSYFFDDIKNASEARAGDDFSAAEIELIRGYRRLPDEALRRQLIDMTKVIGSIRRELVPRKRRRGER